MKSRSKGQVARSAAAYIQFIRTSKALRIMVGRNDAQDQPITLANGDTSQDQIFRCLAAQDATQTGISHQLFDSLLGEVGFPMKQRPLPWILYQGIACVGQHTREGVRKCNESGFAQSLGLRVEAALKL